MSDLRTSLLKIEKFISVSIAEHKLEAYLQIHSWDDATESSTEEIEALLTKHKVIYGIQSNIVTQIAANPAAYLNELIVIARGDEPTDGQDGHIHVHFDLDDLSTAPTELEDGTVDYREIRRLNNVNKGQIIAERFSPVPGVAGKAVTGEALLPREGKEVFFKIGKNVVTDADKNKLFAVIDGLVTKTDRDKINVFPVYEVNGDVDFHIGNIDFVGNVVIRGNVLPGFKIKAAGDIRVTGGVEAAELESGGSIEISEGILGHNKGLVKAGKSVKCSFMQDANIEAEEDVVVSQSIMHSQVRAGKGILCVGNKGLIVGGMIQAGEKVTARTVGNTMSTPTIIEVGVLPELRNELSELREKLKVDKENLDKTEKALLILDQVAAAGQLSSDKLAMRIRLNSTKKATIDTIEEIKQRVMEIEKALEDSIKAEVDITHTVYAGTKVVIGRYVRFIKEPLRLVKFRIIEGDISMVSQ